MVKDFKDVKELEADIRNHGQWSTNDTRTIVRALPLMIKQNSKILECLRLLAVQSKPKKTRKPTQFNYFMGKAASYGLTFKEAAKIWKETKNPWQELNLL